jgi:hypothetical protein
MKTSRRTVLAAMAGLLAAPRVASAAAAADAAKETVAEERFARLIAAAHVPDARARQAERYADVHWRDYVAAARAVLSARA